MYNLVFCSASLKECLAYKTPVIEDGVYVVSYAHLATHVDDVLQRVMKGLIAGFLVLIAVNFVVTAPLFFFPLSVIMYLMYVVYNGSFYRQTNAVCVKGLHTEARVITEEDVVALKKKIMWIEILSSEHWWYW